MTMNMIDFFFEEYNDDDWKRFVNCFEDVDVCIMGVPQDIINVIYSLIGENGEVWLNTPLHNLDGKTALDLLLSEKVTEIPFPLVITDEENHRIVR